MRALGMSLLGRVSDVLLLAMRLGLGTIYLAHSWQKLSGGRTGFETMLAGAGVPCRKWSPGSPWLPKRSAAPCSSRAC